MRGLSLLLKIILLSAITACSAPSTTESQPAASLPTAAPARPPAAPTTRTEVRPLSRAAMLRVVYEIPGMEQADVRKDLAYGTAGNSGLKLDIYYPPNLQEGARRPAVLFVHGSASAGENLKDQAPFVSWGQLIAASDMIAVTFNWNYPNEADIRDLITYIRNNADSLKLDKDRLCVFAVSAGVPQGVGVAMRDTPPFIRCIVAYYGDMRDALPYLDSESVGKIAPILIAKAGKDEFIAASSIDPFVEKAKTKGVQITLLTHPTGVHAFDIRNDDDRSREIIKATIAFIKAQLGRS